MLAARKDESASDSQWRPSLESLCRSYWRPLYFYLRKKGFSEQDSQDLTQDFFASLIEKDFLKVVDPERGRFRWFLMDAIAKYSTNWLAVKSTQKRGGDHKKLSLDFEYGESQFKLEPVSELTPEKLFDREWALLLLQRALDEIEKGYAESAKERYFEVLKIYIVPASEQPSYRESAEQLGLSETAIKVAIHRLRQKYQNVIRRLVADTLDNPEELENEFEELMRALG